MAPATQKTETSEEGRQGGVILAGGRRRRHANSHATFIVTVAHEGDGNSCHGSHRDVLVLLSLHEVPAQTV